MTEKDVATLIRGMAPVLREKFDGLEQRVAALEQQPRGLKYAGVYREGETYLQNECVTHKGSLWICLDKTGLRPDESGEATRAWQLCVKRGRDAR